MKLCIVQNFMRNLAIGTIAWWWYATQMHIIVPCNALSNSKSGRITVTKIPPISIAPPISDSDFMQVASLVVDSFEKVETLLENLQYGNDEKETTMTASDTIKSLFRSTSIGGVLFRNLAIRSTYITYSRTFRRMKGKKYALLLAKISSEGVVTIGGGGLGDVVGMVELGLVRSNSASRPTIGVLCVDEAYRGFGIGRAMVESCEEIIDKIWSGSRKVEEDRYGVLTRVEREGIGLVQSEVVVVRRNQPVYVEVEPTNEVALDFFLACGYDYSYHLVQKLNNDDGDDIAMNAENNDTDIGEGGDIIRSDLNDGCKQPIDKSGNKILVNVKIRKNNGDEEVRPHYLLCKNLNIDVLLQPENKILEPPTTFLS